MASTPLTFNDPTPTGRDFFGRSVALSEGKVLIGAYQDDTNGTDVGQAHLFDAITGALLRTFDDPNPSNGDGFGRSVDIDGDLVLVGAWEDDNDLVLGSNSGQAHLFSAATGDLLHTFRDPTPDEDTLFGNSVSIAGNHVLVGAGRDDTLGRNIGQAHLFDAVSGDLVQTFDDPDPFDADLFGDHVAVSGHYALIGAARDDSSGRDVGQAYLFDIATGSLLHTFDDPTPTEEDLFGQSLAIDGDHVLIGSHADDTNGNGVGQAHLFDAVSGQLLRTFNHPDPTDRDFFGFSVDIEGNRVLVGATGDDSNGLDVGRAYLFDRTSGALLGTFDDPTPTTKDRFGARVRLDGMMILIGAREDDTLGLDVGQAHLFVVPEPSGLTLLAIPVVALVLRRRLRPA